MDFDKYINSEEKGIGFILRSGKVLLVSELIRMTNARKSENVIASHYDITRMSLWKWRRIVRYT